MSRSAIDYLNHILDETEYLIEQSRHTNEECFKSEETLKRAFVRSLEIIGEAAKHVGKDLRRKMPDIEWRKAAGLRDMLVHAYFGIDNDILWDVVQNKVSQLAEAINAFLNKRES